MAMHVLVMQPLIVISTLCMMLVFNCAPIKMMVLKYISAAPKRRRKRLERLAAARVWFDESKILDQSQLCKAMCFHNVTQFRRALKSYHIVQNRNYWYLRNDPDRVKEV